MNPKQQKEMEHEERLVRILSKDIRGGMTVYAGLTKIKGISWSFANAVCRSLKIDKKKKIGELSEAEIKKISEFVKNPDFPKHIFNRRRDLESDQDKHLVGTDLELRTDFDIKRLKKIKSYKGLRHTLGLPVRGQRTKGHFRSNRKKSGGIKSNKKAPENKGEFKGKIK